MRATDLVLDALDRVPIAGFDPDAILRLAMSGPNPADNLGSLARSLSNRRTA
jgi:hypothetical protein